MSTAVWAGCGIALAVYLARRRRSKRTRKSSFRHRLIRTYGCRCMICGSTRKVVAHHIKHYADKGSDDPDKNGVLLCSKCHTAAHKGQFSRRRLQKARRKATKRES